ncbi:SDR family oxidoreductase [Planctomicrobium piriforme]|uniref:SDR family oxidoreductase n=1 Tax=Planctomicrobium piriforme TaxID=1576369 RepID=UPI00158793E3|nr:SDR family oxidoreductase [Planctomicrobium piriforme]
MSTTVRMGPERYTLLTGSTGLLGQFLLADLLRCRIPVAVLVRGDRTQTAAQRLERQIDRFEKQSSRRLTRPVLLQGDLTQSGLGLNPADRQWLAHHCGTVIHSAASLSFKPAAQHPDNEPFRTNVDGTRELLNLCVDSGIREFHDISSSYVCGLRSGRILETDGQHGQKFANDYEQSKLAAEKLVHDAGFDSVTVYRPSIVIDPTPGSLQLGDRTIYYAFSVFQLVTQRFGFLDPDMIFQSLGLSGQERKNIVPAGWVARTIVEIFRRPELHRSTYHLTNPEGTRVTKLMTAFSDVLQPKRTEADYKPTPSAGWGELSSIIEQFVDTFTPYFRDDPTFDQSNLLRALEVCGVPNCPKTDSETLNTLAKQQVSARQPAAKTSTVEKAVPWRQYVDAVVARDDDASEATQESTARFHLTLTGAGGGEWTLTSDEDRAATSVIARGHVGAAALHLYLTSTCWEQLLSGSLDLDEALQSGQLLVELQADQEPSHEIGQLLNTLRDQMTSAGIEFIDRQEVAAYGN